MQREVGIRKNHVFVLNEVERVSDARILSVFIA